MSRSVAIFVDGDNVNSGFSQEILRIAAALGRPSVARVFGRECSLTNWKTCVEFEFVYSGDGKNAADLHLAIDATELVLTHPAEVVLLCSSDSDFAHLARRLRARGCVVVGCGEAKAPDRFRMACCQFHVLATAPAQPADVCPPPAITKLDRQIREVICANSSKGKGMRLVLLSAAMTKAHGTRISQHPDRTWRNYLQKRTTLFDLDPRGQEAKVRIRPDGFGADTNSAPSLKVVRAT